MVTNQIPINNYAENWLNENAPYYNNLSDDEKNTIKTFSLLWSLCESQVLNRFATADLIITKVNEFKVLGPIPINTFLPIFNFFQNRYVADGVLNYKFNSLNFRGHDHKNLVTQALLGYLTEPVNLVTACFLIVFRIRNNFFHGEKWLDGFREQKTLFSQSNLFLTKILEISQVH